MVLFVGEILRTCLRQDFDSPHVHVTQNYLVADELQISLRSLLSQIEPKIGKVVISFGKVVNIQSHLNPAISSSEK